MLSKIDKSKCEASHMTQVTAVKVIPTLNAVIDELTALSKKVEQLEKGGASASPPAAKRKTTTRKKKSPPGPNKVK